MFGFTWYFTLIIVQKETQKGYKIILFAFWTYINQLLFEMDSVSLVLREICAFLWQETGSLNFKTLI